jgi:DNA-binding NtrC family response regulator
MELQSAKQRFGIIGQSDSLNRALSTAIRVSPTDLTVLIQGESGVGKEVFSRIIHDLSKRKHEPFIAINCGAIPEGTINSELFGHEKGSFTGAIGDRKGYFETVNGGTIFLDEIGEMPLDTQAYLLRVLETGEFIRVGASKSLTTDVRVIAATNINLEEYIKKGKFREDLYYRLNTVPIKVPSLYERQEDTIMLFRKFARDFAEKYKTNSLQLTDNAKILLKRYRWPGNIRELKNLVEQLSVLSDEKNLDVMDIIDIAPHLAQSMLPSKSLSDKIPESMSERDVFYNFLIDMKRDISQLKTFVTQLISTNKLEFPQEGDTKSYNPMAGYYNDAPIGSNVSFPKDDYLPLYDDEEKGLSTKPILLDKYQIDSYQKVEIVEDNLKLEDMEKGMIIKALKKFAGKRKEAAEILGISERTLYRKIKQFDLEE